MKKAMISDTILGGMNKKGKSDCSSLVYFSASG
jgi:hypothetical protein